MHGAGAGAAAWETVSVCPAIVNVPLRAAPLLAAAVKRTVPVPVPDVPLVIEIHEALDVAVHVHPLVVVTSVDPLPPLASTLSLEDESEYVHGAGAGAAAAWVTVSVWSAMEMVPRRSAPVFAVAL